MRVTVGEAGRYRNSLRNGRLPADERPHLCPEFISSPLLRLELALLPLHLVQQHRG